MKIICIGRNYVEHVKELNSEVPTEPVFFLKPESSLLRKNHPFFIPEFTQDCHYEVELVLRICKTGKSISVKFAHRYYDAIGVGLDFTARDVQERCKQKGLPWEAAKAFDWSAPVSEFIAKEEFENLQNINFKLEKNGKQVQLGNTSNMIFSFDFIVAYVSKYFTLKMGDFIFTGTPKGVGQVLAGDQLKAYIEDTPLLDVLVK